MSNDSKSPQTLDEALAAMDAAEKTSQQTSAPAEPDNPTKRLVGSVVKNVEATPIGAVGGLAGVGDTISGVMDLANKVNPFSIAGKALAHGRELPQTPALEQAWDQVPGVQEAQQQAPVGYGLGNLGGQFAGYGALPMPPGMGNVPAGVGRMAAGARAAIPNAAMGAMFGAAQAHQQGQPMGALPGAAAQGGAAGGILGAIVTAFTHDPAAAQAVEDAVQRAIARSPRMLYRRPLSTAGQEPSQPQMGQPHRPATVAQGAPPAPQPPPGVRGYIGMGPSTAQNPTTPSTFGGPLNPYNAQHPGHLMMPGDTMPPGAVEPQGMPAAAARPGSIARYKSPENASAPPAPEPNLAEQKPGKRVLKGKVSKEATPTRQAEVQKQGEGVQGNENPKEQGAPERAPRQEPKTPENAPRSEEPTSTPSQGEVGERTSPLSRPRVEELERRRAQLVKLDPKEHSALLGRLHGMAESVWKFNRLKAKFIDASKQAATMHQYIHNLDVDLPEKAMKLFREANADHYSEVDIKPHVSAMATRRSQAEHNWEGETDPAKMLKQLEKMWRELTNAEDELRDEAAKIETGLREAIEEQTGKTPHSQSVEVNGVNFALKAEHTEMRPDTHAKTAIAALKKQTIAEHPEAAYPADAQIKAARAGLNAAIELARKMGDEGLAKVLGEAEAAAKRDPRVYAFPANFGKAVVDLGDVLKDWAAKADKAQVGEQLQHVFQLHTFFDVLNVNNPSVANTLLRINKELTKISAGIKQPENALEQQLFHDAMSKTNKQIREMPLSPERQNYLIEKRDFCREAHEIFKGIVDDLEEQGVKLKKNPFFSPSGVPRYQRICYDLANEFAPYKLSASSSEQAQKWLVDSWARGNVVGNPTLLFGHIVEKTVAASRYPREYAQALASFTNKISSEWNYSNPGSGATRRFVEDLEKEMNEAQGKWTFDLKVQVEKLPNGDKIWEGIQRARPEQFGTNVHRFIAAHLAAGRMKGYGVGKGDKLMADLLNYQKTGKGMTEDAYDEAYGHISHYLLQTLNYTGLGWINRFPAQRNLVLRGLMPLSTVISQQSRLCTRMLLEASGHMKQAALDPAHRWENMGKASAVIGSLMMMRATATVILGYHSLSKEEQWVMEHSNLPAAVALEKMMDQYNLVKKYMDTDLEHLQLQLARPLWVGDDASANIQNTVGKSLKGMIKIATGRGELQDAVSSARGIGMVLALSPLKAIQEAPMGMEVAITLAKRMYEGGVSGKRSEGAYKQLSMPERLIGTHARIGANRNFNTNLLTSLCHWELGGMPAEIADWADEVRLNELAREKFASEAPREYEAQKKAFGKAGSKGTKAIKAIGDSGKKAPQEAPEHPRRDWLQAYSNYIKTRKNNDWGEAALNLLTPSD